MKKRRAKNNKNEESNKVSVDEALQFLDSFHNMISNKDEPSKLISLRIPENILRSLKIKAKYEGKKYQSMIIQAIREYLKKSNL